MRNVQKKKYTMLLQNTQIYLNLQIDYNLRMKQLS